jgi:hypothetical protein
MANFWVNGIVAARDKKPYVQLSNEKGIIGQLSMAQARQVAHDILVMCSRTEADAMILKFFDARELPENAAAMLMQDFRDFRAELDDEEIKHSHREDGEK